LEQFFVTLARIPSSLRWVSLLRLGLVGSVWRRQRWQRIARATGIPIDFIMFFSTDFPNFVMGCGTFSPNSPPYDHCYFIIRIDTAVNAQGQPIWNGSGNHVHFNLGSYGDGQLTIARAVDSAAVATPEPETQFLTLAGLLLLVPGLCLKRGITAPAKRVGPTGQS
jgi:hypothetical protein